MSTYFAIQKGTVLTDWIPHLGNDASGFHVFGWFFGLHCTNMVRKSVIHLITTKKLTYVQFPAAGREVHIWDAHELWPIDNLPEEIKDQEDWQADVSSDEVIDVPWLQQKYLESVEQDDETDKKDAEVAGIGLEGCFVRQCISIDLVICEPLVESHVCDQDDIPSDKTRDRRYMDEPLEDSTPIFANVQVSQESSERLCRNMSDQ